MADRLLLLLGTTTYKASAFLAAARRLAVETVIASDRRQALASFHPGGHLTFDFARPERAADAARRFHEELPITAVVAADDEGLTAAAAIAEALGLRYNPPSAVAAALSKLETRRALRRAGLRTPWFRSFRLDDALLGSPPAVDFPCVVKPLSLSASRGVQRADDPGELGRALFRLRAILRKGETPPAAPEVLVEGFLPGDEVAVEGLVEDGRLRVLAIFDKPDPLDGPFFEETIYTTPSRHPAATREAIRHTLGEAVAALGLRDGPIHAEARIRAGAVWPLEIAPRSIGGLCSRVLRFVDTDDPDASLTLEELILRHALGRGTAHLERRPGAAGVMMIPIPRPGILRRVGGLQSAAAVAGIEEVRITAHAGQPVAPPPEGSRYLGFLFAYSGLAGAAGAGEVEAALRTAHRRLDVDIRPPDHPTDREESRTWHIPISS